MLLATAEVQVIDSNNIWIKCRAVLDSDSQSNFCTKAMFNRLGLSSKEINPTVMGINSASCNILCKCSSTIKSSSYDVQYNLDFIAIT